MLTLPLWPYFWPALGLWLVGWLVALKPIAEMLDFGQVEASVYDLGFTRIGWVNLFSDASLIIKFILAIRPAPTELPRLWSFTFPTHLDFLSHKLILKARVRFSFCGHASSWPSLDTIIQKVRIEGIRFMVFSPQWFYLCTDIDIIKTRGRQAPLYTGHE